MADKIPLKVENGQLMQFQTGDTISSTIAPGSGGPGGANVGTATLDFGAFPGASDASVAVTGQAAMVAGSVVNAWLRPVATADHSADEHWLETIRVMAGNILAGIGFTIYGVNNSQLNEPLYPFSDELGRSSGTAQAPGPGKADQQVYDFGGKGTRIYGQWTIAWQWA